MARQRLPKTRWQFAFELEAFRIPAREAPMKVAADLAHVDEADGDRRVNRETDQRDTVVARLQVLQRRFEDELPARREHARVLEDLGVVGWALRLRQRLADRLPRLRRRLADRLLRLGGGGLG
jgi:hypothetical protein